MGQQVSVLIRHFSGADLAPGSYCSETLGGFPGMELHNWIVPKVMRVFPGRPATPWLVRWCKSIVLEEFQWMWAVQRLWPFWRWRRSDLDDVLVVVWIVSNNCGILVDVFSIQEFTDGFPDQGPFRFRVGETVHARVLDVNPSARTAV